MEYYDQEVNPVIPFTHIPMDIIKIREDMLGDARQGIEACNALKDKEEQIKCKFALLYAVSEAQDTVNLNIRSTIDDDTDPRWLPVLMLDNANAVFLGTSRMKGNPKRMTSRASYVRDKMEGMIDKWERIKEMEMERRKF